MEIGAVGKSGKKVQTRNEETRTLRRVWERAQVKRKAQEPQNPNAESTSTVTARHRSSAQVSGPS